MLDVMSIFPLHAYDKATRLGPFLGGREPIRGVGTGFEIRR